MTRWVAVAVLVAAPLIGCGETAPPSAPPATVAPAENPALAQARDLLKQAETAPLPTPLPPPSPLPRGWKPLPPPELKVDEVEAIRLLEQAAAAEPGKRPAHELLARALQPSALRQHERAAAAKGKKKPPVDAPPDQGVDVSPARVLREYRAAVEADRSAVDLIDPMIEFASRVDDLEAMDWAHRELIGRVKEKDTTGPLLRYADFLAERRKDPLAAVEQYRGALLWMPEDRAIRGKVADIYLRLAKENFDRNEYRSAEVRLNEAEKYVDPNTPQAVTFADYRQRLATIRR